MPPLAIDTPDKPRRLGLGPALATAVVCWGIAALAQSTGLFATLDLRLRDTMYSMRRERPPSEHVVLVAVDDATIGAFDHAWPLRRDYYALLLRALDQAGAAVVGVDVLFLGRGNEPLYDRLLADVTAASPRTVHAFMFPQEASDAGDSDPHPGDLARLERHALAGAAPGVQTSELVSLPYPELLDAAPQLGHIAVALDDDGVVRRLPLVVRYGQHLYPSLALALAATKRSGGEPPRIESARDGFMLRWNGRAQLAVPMDSDGATTVEFAGDAHSFRSYSMLEVLAWHKQALQEGDAGAAARTALAHAFRDRIVVVGTTAVREVATDLGATPFSRSTPLVYVHANVVDAILRGAFVRQPPGAAFLLALLALVLGVGAVFARVPLPVAGAVLAGVLPLVAATSFALLVWGRIAVPATTALLAAPLAYVAIASYRYMFLERRAQESERELHAARTIQQRLLPASAPVVDGLDVFGVNVPAREVGGDYFDFLVLGPGRLLVAVGDVAGKGVPAALLMSHLQASLHAESRDGRTPRAILQAMDELLYRSTASGRYATFFLAIVDVSARSVRYCNAGHNAGLLVRGAELVRLEPGGAALGLLPGTEFEDAGEPFASGDVLVLYSDGITEAVGRRAEMFGDERLNARVLELALRAGTAAEVGTAILDDVRRFTHGAPASDDVTLVVVRRR